jgi:MarR family transcriptional regulator, 2-MHQ and catechol-resistance regulon repressor
MMKPAVPTCLQIASRPGPQPGLPAAAREMTQAYHAFEQFSSRHIRQFGLTTAQFSVLLALSGGPAKSCKALCAQTAITKGTLTGVVDRLVEKGLVRRGDFVQDRRSSSVCLTDEGRRTFEHVADRHFTCLQQAFSAFESDELESIEASLRRFRQLFNQPLTC